MKKNPSFLVINYTEDISGSSVSLVRLLDAMGDTEFTLISSLGSYSSRVAKARKWKYLDLEIPILDTRNLWFYWIIYLKRVIKLSLLVRQYLNQHKPDWILINSSMNIGWIPGWMACVTGKRSRVLWLVHELEVNPKWFFKRIIKIVEVISYKILCVSTPVQSLFNRRTFLLPNITLDSQIERPINPFSQNRIKLLWTGTLIPRKGLHNLAAILNRQSFTDKKISLEIVVSLRSRYKAYLSNCINDLKSTGIEVKVYENIDDPSRFFTSDKILLQTSEMPESFSLTPLEAMSKGMLIFASGSGGITDYGKHDSNLFFWEDLTESFDTTIEGLSKDSDRVLFIQSNALKTSQEYSSRKISERFKEIINS